MQMLQIEQCKCTIYDFAAVLLASNFTRKNALQIILYANELKIM